MCIPMNVEYKYNNMFLIYQIEIQLYVNQVDGMKILPFYLNLLFVAIV
jgi:hypothetical protein